MSNNNNPIELNIELNIMTKYKKECINNFLILLDYFNREFYNFPVEIINLINMYYGYDTPISNLPFFCQSSGRYSLTKDISHDSIESAIYVIGDNISINLKEFTLKLVHNDTIGISINNVSNLLIHNGCIKGKKSTKENNIRGIYVENSKNIIISNMTIKNFFKGISKK